jgi:sterol desaturase/sphingolipid hydroxylase (fatty acid hydroxylase superfamily)
MNRVAAPLGLMVGIVLLLAESRWPLRRAVASKLQRLKTNIGVAAVTAIVVQLVFLPVVVEVSQYVVNKKVGLLNRIRLPESVQLAVALLLLDYTFYWWHRMLHGVGWLWRFHAVHHTDLDLDVSTAARFHFGEWLFSTAYRSVQIVVIGAGPLAESIFETTMIVATLFHHSNVRLPVAFERRLNRLVVTPRMHGIHHSIVEQETNSNFATLLTAWDRLHDTLRLNVAQDELVIGLPAYRDARELTLSTLLLMPFRRPPAQWLLPDGSCPTRREPAAPKRRMVR